MTLFCDTMILMKSTAENTIKKYLPSLKIKGQGLHLKNLPAIYRGLYDFEELDINETPFLLIKVKDKSLGPKDFKKHSKRLNESIDYLQIWFLKELHPHKIRRMIENELNFIVEDKQVHLPIINISIKAEVEKIKMLQKLSGLSVNILIREILKLDLSGKSKVDLADLFRVSKMTMGRAIEPLLVNNLCEEKKVGVSKQIQFKPQTELWSYLQKNIRSPIKEIVFLDCIPKGLPYSAVSALAKQSMLAEDIIPSFAIDKKEFSKKFKKIQQFVFEDDAKARVEIWDRPPTLIKQENVNAVDIYLILKETTDERIKIALEEQLRKYGLEVGKSW
jgi:hypothetical protein